MASTEDDRRQAVAEALEKVRAAGVRPEPELEQLLELYVRGEATLDEIRRALREALPLPPVSGA